MNLNSYYSNMIICFRIFRQGQTKFIMHNVEIVDSKPLKQHPYRMNPLKQEYLKTEIQYLLENDLIEPSKSDWSSPCILILKLDTTFHMCTALIIGR